MRVGRARNAEMWGRMSQNPKAFSAYNRQEGHLRCTRVRIFASRALGIDPTAIGPYKNASALPDARSQE
jgi:hypothetical protein